MKHTNNTPTHKDNIMTQPLVSFDIPNTNPIDFKIVSGGFSSTTLDIVPVSDRAQELYPCVSSMTFKNSAAMELTDFSVFYSQDSIANAEAAIKSKGSRIVVEKGQIVKVSKDKNGIVNREVLTKKWTDWIDYWAVDFDFESKREIIRVKNEDSGEWEERWTGDFIFENEWQSFRTKKDRSLELKSVFHECAPGWRKIAVKVVDIFGTDTMTIVEVNI